MGTAGKDIYLIKNIKSFAIHFLQFSIEGSVIFFSFANVNKSYYICLTQYHKCEIYMFLRKILASEV